MDNLRKKSILLTSYLEYLLTSKFGENIKILTPRDIENRGCQLSVLFNQDIEPINIKLKNRGVICDTRKPNVLRIAPVPLYNSFKDVFGMVNILLEEVISYNGSCNAI